MFLYCFHMFPSCSICFTFSLFFYNVLYVSILFYLCWICFFRSTTFSIHLQWVSILFVILLYFLYNIIWTVKNSDNVYIYIYILSHMYWSICDWFLIYFRCFFSPFYVNIGGPPRIVNTWRVVRRFNTLCETGAVDPKREQRCARHRGLRFGAADGKLEITN